MSALGFTVEPRGARGNPLVVGASLQRYSEQALELSAAVCFRAYRRGLAPPLRAGSFETGGHKATVRGVQGRLKSQILLVVHVNEVADVESNVPGFDLEEICTPHLVEARCNRRLIGWRDRASLAAFLKLFSHQFSHRVVDDVVAPRSYPGRLAMGKVACTLLTAHGRIGCNLVSNRLQLGLQ